jgi:hypothetical protein
VLLVDVEIAHARVLEVANNLLKPVLEGLVVGKEQVGDPVRIALLQQT